MNNEYKSLSLYATVKALGNDKFVRAMSNISQNRINLEKLPNELIALHCCGLATIGGLTPDSKPEDVIFNMLDRLAVCVRHDARVRLESDIRYPGGSLHLSYRPYTVMSLMYDCLDFAANYSNPGLRVIIGAIIADTLKDIATDPAYFRVPSAEPINKFLEEAEAVLRGGAFSANFIQKLRKFLPSLTPSRSKMSVRAVVDQADGDVTTTSEEVKGSD